MSTGIDFQDERYRGFCREKLEVKHEQIPDKVFERFMYEAERRDLDPLTNQIWPNFRSGKYQGAECGIDGFRAIAARTNEYSGQDDPEYRSRTIKGEDGKEHEVLHSCVVRVFRLDANKTPRPYPAEAFFAEYCQYNKKGEVTRMWKTMPRVMLAKCAEALAFRKGFPELAGLYVPEEMDQASNPDTSKDSTPRKPPPLQPPAPAAKAPKPSQTARPTPEPEPEVKAPEGPGSLSSKERAEMYGGIALAAGRGNRPIIDAALKRHVKTDTLATNGLSENQLALLDSGLRFLFERREDEDFLELAKTWPQEEPPDLNPGSKTFEALTPNQQVKAIAQKSGAKVAQVAAYILEHHKLEAIPLSFKGHAELKTHMLTLYELKPEAIMHCLEAPADPAEPSPSGEAPPPFDDDDVPY